MLALAILAGIVTGYITYRAGLLEGHRKGFAAGRMVRAIREEQKKTANRLTKSQGR